MMEQKEHQAINLGKSLLRYGKVDGLDKINDSVQSITAEKLQEIACEVFDEDNLSSPNLLLAHECRRLHIDAW